MNKTFKSLPKASQVLALLLLVLVARTLLLLRGCLCKIIPLQIVKLVCPFAFLRFNSSTTLLCLTHSSLVLSRTKNILLHCSWRRKKCQCESKYCLSFMPSTVKSRGLCLLVIFGPKQNAFKIIRSNLNTFILKVWKVLISAFQSEPSGRL